VADPAPNPVGPETGAAAGPAAAAAVCPLLVLLGGTTGAAATEESVGSGSGLGGSPVDAAAVARSDPANRCAASDPPAPVSLAQQRLVCLDAGHVDCPRFTRAIGSPRSGGGRGARGGSQRPSPAHALPTASPPAARLASAAVSAALVAGPWVSSGSSPVSSPVTTEADVAAQVYPNVRPGDEPPAADAPGSTSRAGDAPGASAGLAADAELLAARSDKAAEAAAQELGPADGPALVPVGPVVRSRRRSGARPARSRSAPVVVAGAILAAALVVAFAFTSIRGGLALPGASPGSIAGVSPTPSLVAASPTVAPTPSPTSSPTPSPSPSPSVAPSPTPTPLASPSPSPTPVASVPPAFVGLKPCLDSPACYLYRVRSGDNLTRIAAKFGITLAALKAANPTITDPSLVHVGDILRIPLPPA
jgi:hypothetical protein